VGIFIRVIPLKEGVFYRLDLVPASRSVAWPTSEVLDKVGLTSRDLGFLGWRQVGQGREFIPLVVQDSTPQATAEGSPIFVVRSPLALEWVKWRVYPLGDSGREPDYSVLPGNDLPPGWPIEIPMPFGRKGAHVVEVYAMPENRDTPETLSERVLL
jgi:hypothetical protein